MYKNTSKNMQGRADRLLMKDMPSGVIVSAVDELDAARARVAQLDQIFRSGYFSCKEEKQKLGQEKSKLCEKVKALKILVNKMPPKERGDRYQSILLEKVKPYVPKHVWDKCVVEANIQYTEVPEVEKFSGDGGLG